MLIHKLIIGPATLAESESIAIEHHNSKWDRSLAPKDLAEIDYQPQRKNLNACDPFGLKDSIMNLRRIKIQNEYPIPVCGLSRTRSISCGGTAIQGSYSGSLLILAVGSLFLQDASLMKTFRKPLGTVHQTIFSTTSLRIPALNNGVQPEQYQRFYINYSYASLG